MDKDNKENKNKFEPVEPLDITRRKSPDPSAETSAPAGEPQPSPSGDAEPSGGAEPAADPNLVLRVAVAAAEFGLPIAPGTLRNLKKCPIGDRNWTDESRELFRKSPPRKKPPPASVV